MAELERLLRRRVAAKGWATRSANVLADLLEQKMDEGVAGVSPRLLLLDAKRECEARLAALDEVQASVECELNPEGLEAEKLRVVEVEQISAPLRRPPVSSNLLQPFNHLQLAADCPSSESTLHIDLVIGQDQYWALVKAGLELTCSENWRHCRSEDNPADLMTRGVLAEQLVTSPLWFSGPEWLSRAETAPVSADVTPPAPQLPEEVDAVAGATLTAVRVDESERGLFQDENQPRFKWEMGVVTRLFPGRDGVPRSAEVRTCRGRKTRAVQRLHDLEILSP
ncbi:hypothetical protein FJT64_011480 [Amphibalanus amphitrite]|uniref:DUF5641 domain-containing protein n=1 Tax=Amphibalanus amphitrite TaxID=1232801 RepID=A0A6A4VIU6_AMPAM|nr:hypothetical protein FJT64_011480 [Amphibalanus amphitrite]